MASIPELKKELVQYDNLKSHMNNAATSLIDASNTINGISNTLKTHYSIDDNGSNLNTQAESISDDIAETSNYLKNTVIPAINSKMEEIRLEIERLEEEEREEEERRKQEEEDRRAAAAAHTRR